MQIVVLPWGSVGSPRLSGVYVPQPGFIDTDPNQPPSIKLAGSQGVAPLAINTDLTVTPFDYDDNGSSDPIGASWQWSVQSQPDSSVVTFAPGDIGTFTTDVGDAEVDVQFDTVGEYVLQIVVTDVEGASSAPAFQIVNVT